MYTCRGCVVLSFVFSRGHVTIAASQANNNTILPGSNEFLLGRKTWTDPSDCPFCVSLWRHLYAASSAALWLDGILSAGRVHLPSFPPSVRPSPSCQTEVTPLRIRIRSQLCGSTARSSRWVQLLQAVSVSLCEDGPSKLQPAVWFVRLAVRSSLCIGVFPCGGGRRTGRAKHRLRWVR